MIGYEKRGHAAVITINRPEARNAVNGAVASGIEDAIDQLEADDDAWVGILTGARTEKGYIFCSGADLKLISIDPAAMSTKRGGFAGIVRRERTKPIIAAVDGPALAGGTEIVLSCDMVVASKTATFGIPEVKRNLVAGAGGLHRLPQVLPRNVAIEMALTGRLDFPAQRAYELGWVNELSEEGEVLDAALALAGRITENAPLAVAASRRVMMASFTQPDEDSWKMAAEAMMEVTATEDFREGIAAFAEKRKPVWKGR